MESQKGKDLLLQIGCRIKQIRSSKGIAQAELADLCGIQKASMSRIEAGKINITMASLLCITNAFEMTMPEFLEALD